MTCIKYVGDSPATSSEGSPSNASGSRESNVGMDVNGGASINHLQPLKLSDSSASGTTYYANLEPYYDRYRV